MLQHRLNVTDELDHDRYQSRRVLADVAHLRRSEIVRQAIADRDRARRLWEVRLMLEQSVEVGFRDFEPHVARGRFGFRQFDRNEPTKSVLR